jgi:predicted MFS family arabinose efflux permease
VRAYLTILKRPGVRAPLLAGSVARLPIPAVSLAEIFLVRGTTGSYASAGVVTAASGIGTAFGLPALGRLVDRIGQTRVLVIAGIVNGLMLVALVAAARSGASVAALAMIGAGEGLSFPPVGLCLRSLWRGLVGGGDALQTAYALDAVVFEVVFIAGPLLAAGMTAAASPSAAVLTCAALSCGGTLAFAATPASRTWRPTEAARHWAGPLVSRGLWVLLGTAACFGFAQGALELTLAAFGNQHGSQALAGPLIAVQSAASLVGGLIYGARAHARPATERWARLGVCLAAGYAPLVLASSVPLLAVLMVPTGVFLAAQTAVEYLVAERVAPPGTGTEAFGWIITAVLLGLATGQAIGGAVANGHARLGFVVAACGAALCAAACVLGQSTLARAAGEVTEAV